MKAMGVAARPRAGLGKLGGASSMGKVLLVLARIATIMAIHVPVRELVLSQLPFPNMIWGGVIFQVILSAVQIVWSKGS